MENKESVFIDSSMIYGTKKKLVVSMMWLNAFFFILSRFPNPFHAKKVLQRMVNLKNRFTYDGSIKKLSKVDQRYFFNMHNNGWPAKYFNRIIHVEGKSALSKQVGHLENIRVVLIGFTKKCPLNCEHCYESEELNKKETLSLEDHKKILKKLQDAGIGLIQFGGGEPMVRIKDLIELISGAQKTSDFWIFTSGFNFTEENAFKLKKAGVTGVSISMDHYDADQHNTFRRNKDSFSWVENAAKNAFKAKIVISFSICVTRNFCTEENLMNYISLAKKMGASFIQLLEPRSVGNYAGQDVAIGPEHEKILEQFYFKMNNDPAFQDMPIVIYHGYRQRQAGCAGAGARYLYIDTDGYMNSCPFCRNKTNHILDGDVNFSIAKMKENGCSKFAVLTELN